MHAPHLNQHLLDQDVDLQERQTEKLSSGPQAVHMSDQLEEDATAQA